MSANSAVFAQDVAPINLGSTPGVSLEKLHASIEQVIGTLLSLKPPAEPRAPLQLREINTELASSVRLHGAWRGCCMVSCSAPVAIELTLRFLGFELDQDAAVLNDVRDCMGEVANIVGGNIKNVLPRGVDHSMPEFAEQVVVQKELVLASRFEGVRGPLYVALFREV